MSHVKLIICILLSNFLGASMHAMEDTDHIVNQKEDTKIYKKTLVDAEKALIVIETILKGAEGHLKIRPARNNQVKIQSKVTLKDVLDTEKHFTEEEFYPFYVNEEAEKVTIKPYIKGTCTVYLPEGTHFTVLGSSKAEIDGSLLSFKKAP